MSSFYNGKLYSGKNIGIYKNEVGSEMYLYGPVGDLFGEECITAKRVKETLKDFDSIIIDVHIHSYGGDAFEGIAIYNILKQSTKTINIYVDGMVASAASIIAMAGDKIFMPKNTQFMIHRAATGLFGNSKDFEKKQQQLESTNQSLIETYLESFIGSEKELIQFMDDEKFFSAKEALKWGFIDEILNYEAKPLEKKEAIENKGKLFMDTKAIELTDKVLKQREQRLVAYTDAMNKAFRNGGKQ